MVEWVKARPLPVLFLATLIFGVVLICVGLFSISPTVGFIGTGALVLVTGHWVTYLTSIRGGTA